MKKHLVVFVCLILCLCTAVNVFSDSVPKRDFSTEEAYAKSLKQLGLFKGVSDTNLDLERAPTRIEALIMLIRVLGEEQKALDGTWRHPFTDVPEWADAYIGYAYVNRLTNGVSATEFGKGNATAATYLTFMLRALGYSDTAGADFSWNNPYDLAKSIGIITNEVDLENFLRADTAVISYAALSAKLKGSDVKLSDKLMEANVFGRDQFALFYTISLDDDDAKTPLTASQIAEKCSSSVFFIEVYAYNGKKSGTGSGFFISEDGYAITNHHVAAYSEYFIITLPDGRKFDDITVLDSWYEQDLALLKINSDAKFDYLELGNSNNIKQGQTVYAIGSPNGLDNTLSQGIISNCKRVIGETEYFQITTPITHGSSGGALIDEYGKVIGVTSAGFGVAELNLAVPINYVNDLEESEGYRYILWCEDDCYPGFSYALDYGIYTGVTVLSCEETLFGYHVRYDAQDFHDIPSLDGNSVYRAAIDCYLNATMHYRNALKGNGFEVEDTDDLATIYKTETETVVFKSAPKYSNVIEVTATLTPVYYDNAPEIPHAGWYIGLSNEKLETTGYKTYTYSYKWNEYYNSDDFLYWLEKYFTWYEEDNFTLVNKGMRGENYIRDFENYNYKVTCSYNETHLYIEITEKQ